MSTTIVIVIIFLVIGALMSIVPMLPGIPLIFLVFLIYGWLDGFQRITPPFLVIMLIIMVSSYLIDNLAGWWGARRYGASRVGAYGAIAGGFLGVVINPLVGIVAGPFLGAVLAELIFSRRPWRQAIRVGVGTLFGFIGGSIVRFMIAVLMVIIFLQRVL